MAERYCTNCGAELGEEARFCPRCGRPVHETAAVPTPEADVSVPPPGSQAQGSERATPPRRSTTGRVLLFGCLGLGLVGVLLAVLVGAALVAGSGGGGPAGGSGGGVAAPEKPETIACEVDKPCDLGDPVLTITKAETTDLISTSLGNSEGHFVLIEFDYTFGGTQPATVQEYRWTLEDGKGRTYNYAFEPTSNYEIDNNRLLLYEKLNPGIERRGAIVFEVAPDAKNFTLHVKDFIQPQTSKRAEVYL